MAVGKAWAAGKLDKPFDKPYYEQPDIQPKVSALVFYLKKEFPKQPLHHRLTALWASYELPFLLSAEEKKQLVAEVLSVQETDGETDPCGMPTFANKHCDARGFRGRSGQCARDMLCGGMVGRVYLDRSLRGGNPQVAGQGFRGTCD